MFSDNFGKRRDDMTSMIYDLEEMMVLYVILGAGNALQSLHIKLSPKKLNTHLGQYPCRESNQGRSASIYSHPLSELRTHTHTHTYISEFLPFLAQPRRPPISFCLPSNTPILAI
ncbi:hypothetical protein L798_11086 [Zootermopsis nevadensis]|uniref:Uncharacterized protein n=1 Tax=Zootermopsis nevadensis TaxID=136037 RepID=A0A067QZU4_ZOONE|nr:hypothetical protein L798_11086 [Zootermopsis nevadensis]